MNDRWLRSFATVAERGSFSAAAEKLFISAQALSQQMNLLDQEVGVRLLRRTAKGISLTPAGREFLAGAREMGRMYERTLAHCRGANRAQSQIRIPVKNDVVIPQFLESVCARYRDMRPALRVELVPDEDFGGWLEGLVDLKYDIIEHFALDGLCPDGIHFEFLSKVTTWCVMREGHPLAHAGTVRPESLAGCRIISPSDSTRLATFLWIYLDSIRVEVACDTVDNTRYAIMRSLDAGRVYLCDEAVSRIFAGYARVPLDFDNHVQHGLACRSDMCEAYAPFFALAREAVRPQDS